ncbi:MAG TPA: hypothetical protein VLF89_06745 [Candidatus Saccharimonadales bacterium]|nr:hypothetical protein [Candidatus Saccharimonadales bacterium]
MAKKNSTNIFTTVTPFSKALAMILFILFPIIGFYAGIQYQKIYSLPQSFIQSVSKITVTPSITPEQSPLDMKACEKDTDCVVAQSEQVTTTNITTLCCGIYTCTSSDTRMAVNSTWLNQRKTNICGHGIRHCPMIRYYCPTPIQSTQTKCIHNLCEVVTH